MATAVHLDDGCCMMAKAHPEVKINILQIYLSHCDINPIGPNSIQVESS
jgi:hypothetical protein